MGSSTTLNGQRSEAPQQPRNIGLDILLYMLQNTDNLLQTIVKTEPQQKSLYGQISSAVDTTVNFLKNYDVGFKMPEAKLEDPGSPNQRQEDPNIGLNRDDYLASNNVIAVKVGETSRVSQGIIENPIEGNQNNSQKTYIKLIPGKNEGESDFIVKESGSDIKTPPLNKVVNPRELAKRKAVTQN